MGMSMLLFPVATFESLSDTETTMIIQVALSATLLEKPITKKILK